ncbi:DUF7677 family protein [Streptomyces bambusae]|uniref:DUF7677 family protein n=1 Tax=Streptomyces bambusae TaxID=1550616 RepID=UPI0040401CD8
MEICVALFANVLEPDEQSESANEKHAERRAPSSLAFRAPTGPHPPLPRRLGSSGTSQA